MEIEKKFLIREIPAQLEQYDKWEIEQGYLCTRPTMRIRKKDEEYIFTYKSKINQPGKDENICMSVEEEFPLTKEAYYHLLKKTDGKVIVKTRYRIPYGIYTIELDLFHGDYSGFCLAEVEFPTQEESRSFVPPDWFGEDVSGDYHYTNSYLAQPGKE